MKLNRFDLSRMPSGAGVPWPAHDPLPPAQGEILVPVKLAAEEARAVALAMLWAARWGAGVTLLRVLPEQERTHAKTDFDAFENLFSAVRQFSVAPSLRKSGLTPGLAKSEAAAFLMQHAPASLWQKVAPVVKTLQGEPAVEIARYADRPEVDLVVLPCRLSTWGLPIVPSLTRRILRQVSKPLVVVRPGAVPRGSSTGDALELDH